ncbi:MAG TPA: helix-turn-helix domain-containing protein [Gemmataceae bacterium]|jgi:AraC family ethanolamine operon transcriptional activator|nr:helix-turn-helix domain-containing protein [Gemmataceae bacterium]
MIQAVPAPVPPFALSVRTVDFDELAQGIPGWDAVFSQVSPGPFRGEFDFLQLGAVAFCRIAANREILARGAHRPGAFGFGVPTLRQETSLLSGQPVHDGQVIFLGPDDTLDQKTCADYQAVFVEVEAADFLAGVGALTRRDVQADLAGKSLLSPSPGASRRLAAFIRQVFEAARTDRDALTCSEVQRRLCHGLLSRLAEVITDPEGPDACPRRLSSRRQLVAEAEALMGSRPWGALTMSGLCRELEVSERSLHYAFRDVLGQTPMAYYRHKRLNAVRRLLKQAGSLQTTVAEVGRAWGFWHTGQFAADYRRLFGEIPSTTLATACQEE